MALETLKNMTVINGIKVMDNSRRPTLEDGKVDWEAFDKMRSDFPVCVDHEKNMISFKIQDGPIGEVGKNGCQVTALIEVAKHIIHKLNQDFPCEENLMTIEQLRLAINWQNQRTKDRKNRNVEGKNLH